MKSIYTLALLLLASQSLFLTCQAGSCAGMTADGLLPDEYGDQTRDCCPTYDTECAGITGSGEDDCYCDTNCGTFGDCCDDHDTTCAWIFWDNATDVASDTSYVSESNVDYLVFTVLARHLNKYLKKTYNCGVFSGFGVYVFTIGVCLVTRSVTSPFSSTFISISLPHNSRNFARRRLSRVLSRRRLKPGSSIFIELRNNARIM